ERLLARLAVEPAVTGGAHHALDQQVVGPGGDRAAPVRLLEAQRYPRVAGLVQGDERRPHASSPFRVHRVRDRRPPALPRLPPPHAPVELVLAHPAPRIAPLPPAPPPGRAHPATALAPPLPAPLP